MILPFFSRVHLGHSVGRQARWTSCFRVTPNYEGYTLVERQRLIKFHEQKIRLTHLITPIRPIFTISQKSQRAERSELTT
jgi:hypothetical protein